MPLPDNALAWAVRAFKDGRNANYDTYAAYIAGDQPITFGSEKVRGAFARTFSSFSYNRCRMVRDAHADRLQVQGFGSDSEALSQAAQDLWDANSMDLREGHLEQDAFGLGDAYLIVEMHPERGDVHFWVQDPRNMRVHYADDVPGELDLAAKAWKDPDTERVRMNLYFRDRIEKYVTQQRSPSGIPTSDKAFVRYEDDAEPWPLPLNIDDRVPVFHIANNGRTNAYGESEIVDVIPLQDAINYTAYCMFVGMEFSAFSQRVFIGVQTAETDEEKRAFALIEAGITRAITLEDPNAKIAEFSPTDVGQYLNVLEFLDMAVCRVTKVPPRYLGIPEAQQSGISKRIDHSPFTAKLEDRAKSEGQVLAEALLYGLRLQGVSAEPGALRVNWGPLAPVTEGDVWDLVLQKVTAGLPFLSALREAGYEPDQIDTILEDMAEEQARRERAFNAGVLARSMFPAGDDEGEA